MWSEFFPHGFERYEVGGALIGLAVAFLYVTTGRLGGASTVFVNGKPVLLAGAVWAVHGCGDDAHDGTSTGCSSTVFVEGHGVVRVGDDISCGSAVAEGSSTVFAGG